MVQSTTVRRLRLGEFRRMAEAPDGSLRIEWAIRGWTMDNDHPD